VIKGGDIQYKDNSKGVVMKSANGQCWKLLIDNTGKITTQQVTCP